MEWGTVPAWVEALAVVAFVVEVYVAWWRDPQRPGPLKGDDEYDDEYGDVNGPW